jgi:hypothetical protein
MAAIGTSEAYNYFWLPCAPREHNWWHWQQDWSLPFNKNVPVRLLSHTKSRYVDEPNKLGNMQKGYIG